MNAAETRASSAIALWTELTVVSRSVDDRRDRHIHQRRVDDEHEHRRRQQERQAQVPSFLRWSAYGLFASHAIWPTLTAAGHTTIRTWVTDGRPPDDPPRPLCMHLDGRTSAGRSVAPACAIAGEENPPDPAAVLSFMAPRYWARGGGGGNGLTLPRGRLSDDKQLLSASPTLKRKRVMRCRGACRRPLLGGWSETRDVFARGAFRDTPARCGVVAGSALGFVSEPCAAGVAAAYGLGRLGRRPSDPSIWTRYPRCAGRLPRCDG